MSIASIGSVTELAGMAGLPALPGFVVTTGDAGPDRELLLHSWRRVSEGGRLPVVVRSCEEVLKLVPNELREASYALGVPKWRTVVKVVLPTAVAGLGTGITLSVARVIGETAPLLITVGLITGTNLNPFDGRMATLPVFAYYQLTQPGTATQAFLDRAWTAALVLIIFVMALNIVARLISRFFAPKTGR